MIIMALVLLSSSDCQFSLVNMDLAEALNRGAQVDVILQDLSKALYYAISTKCLKI